MKTTILSTSSTSRTSLLKVVVQACGHEAQIHHLLAVLGVRGPCDACWRVIREEKEAAEWARYLYGVRDKDNELKRSKDPTQVPRAADQGKVVEDDSSL